MELFIQHGDSPPLSFSSNLHKGKERRQVFVVINDPHMPPRSHIMVIDVCIVLKSSN